MITLAFHLKRGHLADREARAGLRIGVHLAFVEELQKLISESGLAVTDHSEESVWVLHAKNSRGKADLLVLTCNFGACGVWLCERSCRIGFQA